MRPLALTAIAAIALAVPFGCGDHDHDHDAHPHDTLDGTASDDLAQAACEAAQGSAMAVSASTDAASAETPVIVAGSGAHRVTLSPGYPSYVWLVTESDHFDAALFTSPSGIATALESEDGAPFSFVDNGAVAACSSVVQADLRIHLHMAGRYKLTLDGVAGTEAWLFFVNEASEHAQSDEDAMDHGEHDTMDQGEHDVMTDGELDSDHDAMDQGEHDGH